MFSITNYIRRDKEKAIKFAIIYLMILLINAVIAKILTLTLWSTNTGLLHTSFELICIFIALFSFFIIWFTYQSSNLSNRIIGIGFLAVAVFDIFHTYYFPSIGLYPEGSYDLSTRYWLMGRFAEAVILLLNASNLIKRKLNKWASLSLALMLSLGASVIIFITAQYGPVLLTDNGVTPPKIIIEYLIIAIFLLSFILMMRKLHRKSIISYKYICMSIMIVIPAELCFTLFKSIDSFINVYGHLLKVVYYYFLLYGIFVSGILYPYNTAIRAKMKLQETRQELKDILDGLPLALVNYDKNKIITYANKMALDILECTCANIAECSLQQMREKLTFDNKSTIESLFAYPNEIIDEVNRYKTFKGNEIDLSVKAFAYKGGVLVAFSDARKDQELRDLKIQTRTILNAISNHVVITDTDLKIIMFNKAFKRCFEMRDKDIIGRNINSIYCEVQLSIEGIPFQLDKSDEKNNCYLEASLKTLRGNEKIILLNYNPVFNVKDEIIGYIFVSSDITEIKKEQQKALKQEKLAIIGQMGSGIVHETKNHLASIKGYCQLLEQKLSDEQLIKYVDRIETISEDVNKVIIDFLSLAKPAAETIMDIISLNETIKSMRYMLESPSFVRGVKINIQLAEDERDIKGNETQIKQVILNMAKNAIEAMAGITEPVLWIKTEACDEKSMMKLIISDNGRGIAQENLDKIGTIFFTTKETGTGLGLNLCYKIIKEHSGSIVVESEEGKGTTFCVSIPYCSE